MGDGQGNMALLEYMKGWNEDATGWTRYNQGEDGDTLNHTATGITQLTSRADMRLDLIARNFAEGFRDLFRMMLKLVSQYSQKEEIIKLRGEWVAINPRDWMTGFDATINVGLGTGNKDQLIGHLTVLNQQQQLGLQIGTATPENLYQAQTELVKAMGFKSADKFFTDPAKAPPRPPQPHPEVIKAQAQQQVEQMKAQLQSQVEQQRIQMEHDLEAQRMQMQAQVDTHRQQVEAQQQAIKAQQDQQLEQFRAQLQAQKDAQQLQFDQWKVEMDNQTKIAVAEISAKTTLKTAAMSANSGMTNPDAMMSPDGEIVASPSLQGLIDTVNGSLTSLVQSQQSLIQAHHESNAQLVAAVTRPRVLVRGADGRAVGVQ